MDVADIEYPQTYEGRSVKPLRGASLIPVLTGKSFEEESTLYWEHFGHQALRRGKWKIVADTPDEQWQLFDMENDPTELQDVSSEFEDVVKTLTADYQRWAQEVGVRKAN